MFELNAQQKAEKINLRKQMYAEGTLNTLRELIFRTHKYFPGNPSVVERIHHETVMHTVDELFSDIRALGTYFAENGFHRKHIAVLGANSYRWIVTFFAVTASGNTVVTLDRELPPDDILRLLTKAEASAVFVGKGQIEKTVVPDFTEEFALDEKSASFVSFDELIEKGNRLLREGSTLFDEISVTKDDTACIIFTSGTTGANKGVMLSHRNLCYQTEEFIKGLSPMALS